MCRRFDCRESAAWKIDVANEPAIAAAGQARVDTDVALPATAGERAAYRDGFAAAREEVVAGADAGEAAFTATTVAAKSLAALGDDAARDALVDFGWRREGIDRQNLLRALGKQRRRIEKLRRRGDPIDAPPVESWD